jgi:hypothetical protein
MQALTQGLIQRRLDSFSTPVVPSKLHSAPNMSKMSILFALEM